MKLYSVDRIEGTVAVCEDENGYAHEFPLALLPGDAKEGSVLRQNEAGGFVLDREAECLRRNKLFQIQEDIFQ